MTRQDTKVPLNDAIAWCDNAIHAINKEDFIDAIDTVLQRIWIALNVEGIHPGPNEKEDLVFLFKEFMDRIEQGTAGPIIRALAK